MSNWQIEIGASQPAHSAEAASAVPLKWAHDAQTGEALYIHDPEIVDQSRSCVCPACELPLTPVLAGQPLRVRPTAHFRHPAGSQKDSCSLVAARLAATRHLLDLGVIELPRRRLSRTAQGFSGEGYEVWVEAPPERVAITSARLRDHATALLILDDGRELLVDLTGLRESGQDGQGRAIVTVALSDPSLAMLGPDEIRARLRLLPDIRWCAHWRDDALAAQGDKRATQAARDALDAWQDADEAEFQSRLPAAADPATTQRWRRETLLHRLVKTILEGASSIATPGLEVSVRRDPPEEFAGEWDDQTLDKTWMTAPRVLELDDVQLEQRTGRIVPDVIATLGGRQIYTQGGTMTRVGGVFDEDAEDSYCQGWPATLLIEVTVTHGIDAEKLARIRELDVPTLEIDIGSLGGKVTFEGLRDLVVRQTIGKRWVHHPILRSKQRLLEMEIEEHPATLRYRERLAELRRPAYLATPVSDWATRFLVAATEFHDANTRIKIARRKHQGNSRKPELLGEDSAIWACIKEAAEALAAHGLVGAADSAMMDEAGLLPRLLSLQNNRGVGYAVDTGFQVLNAIMQSGADNKRWDTLYTMAVKTYGLDAHFSQRQKDLYADWRKALIAKVEAGDEAYRRPARYDPVLSALFPDMAPRIATGYGRSNSQ